MSRVKERPQPSGTPLFGSTELRVLLVLMQALAIGLTWHLWQVRTADRDAPNLPLIDAGWVDSVQFGFGWPLLVSLLLAVAWPMVGVVLHCGLLLLAIGMDQMRIQPEFVSVAILLVGTLPGRGPKLFAQCHLIALWFWAGLHKLLSVDYLFDSGPQMWTDTMGDMPRTAAVGLAIFTAVFELALGLLALYPHAWRFVPWLAALLHLGILMSLIVQRWNPAVWPWNVALIVAAAGLFGNETTAARQTNDDTGCWKAWSWKAAAAIALLHPGLYYLGLADAYLSWCVYSSNQPVATQYAALTDFRVDDMIHAGKPMEAAKLSDVLDQVVGDELAFKHYASINVPFSPAPRLYAQYFRRVGQPGEMLVIHDPRLIAAWRQRDRIVLIMSYERKAVPW